MNTRDEIADYCKRHHYSAEYTEYAIEHRFCEVCGLPAVLPHHIRSRGAGGSDEAHNLLSLCRTHHTVIHNVGPRTFCDVYPNLADKIHAALEVRR